jgi:hypothetical protein
VHNYNIIKIKIKMSKVKCDKCHREFTNKAGLTYHQIHKSCKIRAFVCKHCHDCFTTKGSLQRHIDFICEGKQKKQAKSIFDFLKISET